MDSSTDLYERVDDVSELAIGSGVLGDCGAHARDDRGEHISDDAGIERALVGKVVIDHRLVDPRALGDAVDGGGGKAAGAKLVAGGSEDSLAGVGGACLRASLTDRLVNTAGRLAVKVGRGRPATA